MLAATAERSAATVIFPFCSSNCMMCGHCMLGVGKKQVLGLEAVKCISHPVCHVHLLTDSLLFNATSTRAEEAEAQAVAGAARPERQAHHAADHHGAPQRMRLEMSKAYAKGLLHLLMYGLGRLPRSAGAAVRT